MKILVSTFSFPDITVGQKMTYYHSIPSGQCLLDDNEINYSQWTFGSFWLNLMTGAFPSNNLDFSFFCSHTLLAIECVLPSPIKPLFSFLFFLAFWTYFDNLTHPQKKKKIPLLWFFFFFSEFYYLYYYLRGLFYLNFLFFNLKILPQSYV